MGFGAGKQSISRQRRKISYAVFCMKKKSTRPPPNTFEYKSIFLTAQKPACSLRFPATRSQSPPTWKPGSPRGGVLSRDQIQADGAVHARKPIPTQGTRGDARAADLQPRRCERWTE